MKFGYINLRIAMKRIIIDEEAFRAITLYERLIGIHPTQEFKWFEAGTNYFVYKLLKYIDKKIGVFHPEMSFDHLPICNFIKDRLYPDEDLGLEYCQLGSYEAFKHAEKVLDYRSD